MGLFGKSVNGLDWVGWGGSGDQTPQAPSISDILSQYQSSLPGLYQTNANLMNQYEPGLLGLPSQLAQQASAGMNSNMPDWMKQQYQSDMSARLGSNAGAGIGADYLSRGMLNQQQNWRQYYQNLGLQTSQMLPGIQGALSGNFTPGQALGYAQGTYSSYLPQYTQAQQYNPMMSMIGGIGGTIAGSYFGGMPGASMGGQAGNAFAQNLNTSGQMGNGCNSFNSQKIYNGW